MGNFGKILNFYLKLKKSKHLGNLSNDPLLYCMYQGVVSHILLENEQSQVLLYST